MKLKDYLIFSTKMPFSATKKLLGVLLWLNLSTYVNAQCTFYENFNNSPSWTQVGENVEIRNNRVEYINGAADAQQRRVYKSLGTTLNANDTWKAEMTFHPEKVGESQGHPFTGHMPLTITSGTADPRHDCPDIPCTGYPTGKQQGVGIIYGANNPADGDMFFLIWAHDGSKILSSESKRIIANTLGKNYYVRLQRNSADEIELSIFTDSQRKTHLSGSPISMALPKDLTGLNTVQVGNSVSGWHLRELTGWVDDICISKSCIEDDFADAGRDQYVCHGGTALLDGHQGAKYEWSPSTHLNIANGPKVFAMPPSDQEYRLVVTTENGCTDTDFVWVRVREEVVAHGRDTSTICKGDTVPLEGSGGDYYQWSPIKYLESPSERITKAFPEESIRYMLVVFDSFGCVDTTWLHVDVKSTVTAYAEGDKLLCLGDSISLTATGGSNYLWTSKDTLENAESSKITVSPKTTTFYFVEVSDVYGCKEFDTVLVNTITDVIAKVSKDTSICEGDSLTLMASGGIRYLWRSKDSIGSPTLPGITVTPVERTQYRVTVSASTDCSDSASVWVDVGQQAIANFKMEDSLWKAISTYTFLNTSTRATEYEWWVENSFFNTEKDLTYTFVNNDEYVIKLIAKGTLGCNDTLTKTTNYRLVLPLKIPNIITANNDGKNDLFFIEGLWEGSSLEIYNRWGQPVFNSLDYQNDWDGYLKNGTALSEGTYYYVFTSSFKDTRHHGSILLIR